MSNFSKVGIFMKTFGQEVKDKPSFSTDKINKLRIDLIKTGLTKNSPISKYFFDLCVEAPQYLSPGTFIEPMLSNSFLNFID
mgnify:FL=1